MKEEKYIIVLRGVDRTVDIKSIKNMGDSYQIMFHHSNATMRYHRNEINAEVVISHADRCDSILVKVNGQIVDASKIYQSENYFKIIKGDERSLFHRNEVQLLPCKSEIKNLDSKLIYLAGFPVPEVEALYDFGAHYRIVRRDGTRFLCPSSQIHIDVKRPLTDEMIYLAKIASIQNDGRPGTLADLMLRQYEQMKYINSDSVLNAYLRQFMPAQVKLKKALIYPFSFHLSQKQAVESAFENKISLLETPPGTGREESILNIIVNAVRQNKTIAILSGNYDNLAGLRERLNEENYSFITANLGSDAFFYNQPSYPADLPEWQCTEAEKRKLFSESLQYHRELIKLLEIQRGKAMLLQEINDLSKEKEYFDAYYESLNMENKEEGLSLSHLSCDNLISFLADNTIQRTKGKFGLVSKLKFFTKYGVRNFKDLDDNNFEVVLQFQKKYYETKLRLLKRNMERLDRKLFSKDFNRKAMVAAEKATAVFQFELFERYKDSVDVRPVFDKDTYKEDFASFVKEYPVVFCDPASLRGSIPQDYLFDYIVIDRASEVDLAAAALALSCSRNAVLVGDVKQHPLVVDAKRRAAREEAFHRFSINDEFNYNRHSILSSMDKLFRRSIARTILREHTVCRPQIIQFCNKKYYNENMVAVTETTSEVEPLILLNTVSSKHVRMIPREDANDEHYNAVESITEDLLVRGSLTQEHRDQIGYETPYWRRSMGSDGRPGDLLESDLASRYQGAEKDIMIFSAVLDLPRQVGDSSWSFTDDPRQVNLAVSRAKQQLVVVTTESIVKTQGSNVGDLIRDAEYQTRDENFLARDLIPVFDLLYRDYSRDLIALKSKMKYSVRSRAAAIMSSIIENVLRDSSFRCFSYAHAVPLRVLFNNWEKLDAEESSYALNPSNGVDFVIYNCYDKLPVLAIEVGGMAYRGKKTLHLIRDDIKERILEKYQIDLLWISINEGWEGDILRTKLEEILSDTRDYPPIIGQKNQQP